MSIWKTRSGPAQIKSVGHCVTKNEAVWNRRVTSIDGICSRRMAQHPLWHLVRLEPSFSCRVLQIMIQPQVACSPWDILVGLKSVALQHDWCNTAPSHWQETQVWCARYPFYQVLPLLWNIDSIGLQRNWVPMCAASRNHSFNILIWLAAQTTDIHSIQHKMIERVSLWRWGFTDIMHSQNLQEGNIILRVSWFVSPGARYKDAKRSHVPVIHSSDHHNLSISLCHAS